MKTETEKLAALVNCALQKKQFIAVSDAEILNALNALEIALECMPFCSAGPLAAKNNLLMAARVLSHLMYGLDNNLLNSYCSNRKHLLTQVSMLYKKLNSALKWYCNDSDLHCGLLTVKNLLKILLDIDNSLKQNESISGLYSLVQPDLHALQKTKTLPCHRWIWWSQFSAAVPGTGITGIECLEDILIKLNFNTPAFIRWLTLKLQPDIETTPSVNGKFALITRQFLKYNTLHSLADGYLPAERCVKQTMLSVLHHCLLCLRAVSSNGSEYPESNSVKLHTQLSVPQLALFIRLMVDTKIINDTNYSALLKNVASTIYTSKAASISSESLRVNYYTPGNAAKSIVKDYLLNMLNLLKTY